MADEKKTEPNLDDWDSLALDPGGDDWDDIPPLSPAPAPLGPDQSFEAQLNDEMNQPDDLPEAAAEPPADVPADVPDDTDGADEDDLSAHLAAAGLGEAFGALEKSGPDDRPPEPAENLAADLPATTKVELDIEGIFLDDLESAKAEPPAEPVPEPPRPEKKDEPQTPAPAPEKEPSKRKIPQVKLLMVGGGAFLLLAGLAFGVYKIFLAGPKVDESQAVLVIDPRVPPREPAPGDLELAPFYLNFSGPQGETLVEMAVTLHYQDLTDRFILEARMPAVRDLIARAAKEQGDQVVTSAELQRALRQSAADQVNRSLGGPHLSYVQISQIRVLH